MSSRRRGGHYSHDHDNCIRSGAGHEGRDRPRRTTKGLFTLRSGDGRERFELTGPTFAGEEVYATCIDSRSGSTRLFTGSVSNHWGPVLRRSDDLGATWTEDEQAALRFAEGADASLERIWQLACGPDDEPDVLYAGVEPAALFRSDDGGGAASRWSRGCGTTHTARSGNRAEAACASTPSSCTPTTPTAC